MSIIKFVIYKTNSGRIPFNAWRDDLDPTTRAIIRTRLNRIALGNFGNCKAIKNGGGIWEFKIDYGPGYRIYFGKQGISVIVLLLGGDKGSQSRDIIQAKRYWQECKEEIYE